MGLFASEPEDTQDWTGLPAEPLERDDVREPSTSSDDEMLVGLLGGTTSVPLDAAPLDEDEDDEDEDDEAPR